MKRARIFLTFGLALLVLGGGALRPSGLHAAVDFPPPSAGLSAIAWQTVQSQVAKLTAADGAADDHLGNSVSIDGETAVVGAVAADILWGNEGAAYVFYRDQGGVDAWGQVAKLTAADGTMLDCFGSSVSVSGDTVVVGAYGADPGGISERGAAYVFYRNWGGANAWGQVAKLTAADGGGWNYFGHSVSVSGATAVVAAPWADVDGAQGAAYVFSRNQGGADAWGQVAKLTAADGGSEDNFGYSVSVDADTAIVGAKGSGAWGQGAAYVFYRNQGGADAWGQVAKLTAADAGDQYRFGQSVSVSGDTAVAAAPYGYAGGAWGQGAAYVFYRDQGGADAWGQVVKFTAADGATMDGFGTSVSVRGDTAVAGAYGADVGGGVDQGAAYVFYRDQGEADAWGQVAKLTAADCAEQDNFGKAVSVDGLTALVGAYGAEVGANADQGAAYVYSLPTPPTAGFSASPTGGPAPLTVAFTNTSTGDYNTFLWDLGDGYTSSEENPSHIYSSPGVYTVSLTVSGLAGPGTLTREDYITAYTPVSANFTGAPRVGVVPLGVAFTNTSTGDYTTSFWRFGDGGTSTLKNPGHRYASIGNYTVILTVKGPGGTNTLTRTDYIGVYAGMAHVDLINLSYVLIGGQYVVTAVVRLLDQNSQPVSAAAVTAQWTLPNGSLQYRQNQTNANGVIGFQVQSPMMGPYKLCVLNVTKTDWYYDRMRNVETCDQKTVP